MEESSLYKLFFLSAEHIFFYYWMHYNPIDANRCLVSTKNNILMVLINSLIIYTVIPRFLRGLRAKSTRV